MLRIAVSSRASQLCRLPTIQKARNGSGHRQLHLLQLNDPSAFASRKEEERPSRQRHPCRAYHTSRHQPILPLIVGCVAAAGGYVVYRKLQGLPTLPNEATKAKEAYRKQQQQQQQQIQIHQQQQQHASIRHHHESATTRDGGRKRNEERKVADAC